MKQPKATCALFFIACKINLGLVKKQWKSGWERVTVIQEIRVGGGFKKPCHPSGVCGFFLE